MKASLDDEAVVAAICDRLIGGEGIKAICRDPTMPAATTVYVRMASDEGFRTRIARAREAQQEALIDDTVEMADLATVEDHQVVKLRIWARQWRASKLAPKKYGDRVVQDHQGAIEVKSLGLDQLDPAEREVLRDLLRRRAGEPGSGTTGA